MTQQHEQVGAALRARAVQAHALVSWAAERLGRSGIAAAPLKGALLNATIYARSAPCPVGDADLLVPPHDFDRAQISLERAGGLQLDAQRHASTWRFDAFALPLDLHRHLVDPAWFELSTSGVLARATVDTALFAPAEVLLLDPYDAYVHLVADFAKSRRGLRFSERLRDLRVLARQHRLDPVEAARRLCDAGAARAARYVLSLAGSHEGDRFAAAVVTALPVDPLGQWLAATAGRHMAWRPDGDWRTTLTGHALNTTLQRGAASLLRSVLPRGLGQGHVGPVGS